MILEKLAEVGRQCCRAPALALGLLAAVSAFALSAEEEAVAKRVEAFRTAQIAQDARALDELTAPELSYSHSDARVEDKAAFVKNATSEKSKTLSLVGDVAIVRFHWSETVADGPGPGSC